MPFVLIFILICIVVSNSKCWCEEKRSTFLRSLAWLDENKRTSPLYNTVASKAIHSFRRSPSTLSVFASIRRSRMYSTVMLIAEEVITVVPHLVPYQQHSLLYGNSKEMLQQTCPFSNKHWLHAWIASWIEKAMTKLECLLWHKEGTEVKLSYSRKNLIMTC